MEKLGELSLDIRYKEGPLNVLPIPTKKLDTVTMDFITGLPEHNGKNALMV